MATRLGDKMYVGGGYLDSSISVNNISELMDKLDFLGQSIHMPEAFVGVNDIPYPLDFWSTPNGEDVKWELKSVPSLESEDDFNNFKAFCTEFKNDTGYLPITKGIKVLVNGAEYECFISENGDVEWINTQAALDEALTNAVDDAVSRIKGDAEEFNTLKDVEDWIKNNSGNTGSDENSHTHENKEILDSITAEKVEKWDNSSLAGGTVLDESITVTNETGNYKQGMTIEEGTSILEVIKNFLHKTTYPLEATKPNASIEFEKLNESYEVGSIITLPKFSVITENGKFNYEGYNGVEVEGGAFDDVKIRTELIKGFENYAPREYATSIDAQTDIVILEGNNEISINGYAKYSAPTNMPTTSEGVSTNQTGETATNNAATWTEGTIELNETIKINGYRNVYFGAVSNKTPIDVNFIKKLQKSNKEVNENDILEIVTKNIDNQYRMVIAIPSNKKLELVEDSTSTQDLTKLLLLTETQIEIPSENNYDTCIYNVYDKTWAGSFGNEVWKIKLKNK